jgi:hypothetical protein
MESSDTNRLSDQQIDDLLLQRPATIFGDPNRVALLETLESLFEDSVSPDVWSFLWMSDIEMLNKWVNRARDEPNIFVMAITHYLLRGKIVQHCKSIAYIGIGISLLIFCRDSTRSHPGRFCVRFCCRDTSCIPTYPTANCK